ncbi:MAG: mismatch repair protein MutS [Planctomycetota bacterium]
MFFFALALLLYGYTISPSGFRWVIAGWISAGLFLVVITLHEMVRLSLWGYDQRAALFQRLQARLAREWDSFPFYDAKLTDRDLATGDDLDVTGRASLMHWLCFAETQPSRNLLLQWIIQPPDVSEIRKRQAAVRFYSQQNELREKVYSLSAEVASGTASPDKFLAWATGPTWLGRRPFLRTMSWLGLVTIITGIAMLYSGRAIGQSVPLEWSLSVIVGGIILNVIVSVGYGSFLHEIFQSISSRHQEIAKYQELVRLMTQGTHTVGDESLPVMVAEMKHQIEDESNALKALASLDWRVRFSAIRHNPLFFVPYLMLQVLCAWDFRSIELLERWKIQYGKDAPGWFSALAKFEVLCSLATVPFEHPDWCQPSFRDDNRPILSAKGLGHPLLRNHQRVCNDIEFTEDKPLWMITGSNMSGKSTFLRALGINILLARTGSPVCAQRLEMPPIVLATSIRIRDSLDQGISYFMAELRRLRSVVDISEEYKNSSSYRVLFLLDEIMQGTNSRERHIAVGHVLSTLLGNHAFGAVTTHDLDLVSHSKLVDRCEVVHFRESFEQKDGERRMVFDYRMRPGATPTTNALKLLALVGLGDLTRDDEK